MPPVAETRVLFIPYRPSQSSKQAPETEISLQKHAAREYHRKAKLLRHAARPSRLAAHPRGQTKQTRTRSNALPTREPQNLGDDEDTPAISRRARRQNFPGTNAFRIRRYTPSSPSPHDIGVGQLDPFSVSIRRNAPRYVQEMLDHGVTYQWPEMSCSPEDKAISEIKHDVLASTMRSSATFYSIVFAGATHNAFAHTGLEVTRENKILRLAYKTHAIEALKNEIRSLSGKASDELLLCMFTLGTHGSGDTLAPRPGRTNDSTLITAQSFAFYGHMNWETAHFDAMRVLIEQRGGFHTVHPVYLSNAIALADVFMAFKNLRAPYYPLRVSTSLLMRTWPHSNPNTIRAVLRNFATGFQNLPEQILSDHLFQTIDTIQEVTFGYDLYLRKDKSAPRLIHVIWGRNCLLHDLLSLPDRSAEILDFDSYLYEVCRLGTLAYMLLVLFPLPRVSGLHYTLAQRLMLALDNCSVSEACYEYPDLLLWAMVLGGILADGTDLRPWFIELLTRTPETYGSWAWGTVKEVCAKFLWLEEDCDEAGEAVWREVDDTLPPSRTLDSYS